jgi:hypothetical protein
MSRKPSRRAGTSSRHVDGRAGDCHDPLSAGPEGDRVVRAGPIFGKVRRVVEDARGHGVSHFNLYPEAGKENRNETNRTESRNRNTNVTDVHKGHEYLCLLYLFVLPSPKCEQTSVIIQAILLCHASHVAEPKA